MTAPGTSPAPPDTSSSSLLRTAIWVAIGALIAAAIVSVIWVLVGRQGEVVGKAFLTILLLAAFAGVIILDVRLAPRRPTWFALASTVTWVVTLLLGAVLIWMPAPFFGYLDGIGRFTSFVMIVLILQGALLHVRVYLKAHQRYVTSFTRTVVVITIGLVALLAVLLVLPLVLWEWVGFPEGYWRVVVAVAILAAVGTTLIPLLNALFAPKRPRPAAPAPAVPPGYALPPWPTYADGRTPLPVMPDGSPDWNAYYTGFPTYPHGYPAPTDAAAPASASAQPVAAAPVWTPNGPQAPAASPAGGTAGSPAPAAPPAAAPPAAVPAAGSPAPAAPPTAQHGEGYAGFPPPPPLPPQR